MNYVKRPKEEKVVLRMQQLYLKTERKLINEITRKRALGQVDYADVAALERVQKILTDMQSEAFEYVPQMVETIFHGEGEKNAAGYANARALTTAQIDVSQALINNLLGEIVEASNTALESATTWLSIGRLEGDEFRNAALQFTAEQQAMGASWQMAQKNMAVDLQARGITAFVDKAGRQWNLTDYCTMATRTTARQASIAANLTRDDHDLWQISRIGSTCPVCAVYEGRVYSKSGTNPDYPPLAAAFGKIDPYGPNDLTNTYLNIHPNCLHSLMKYTTIGKSDKEIQRDKDFSSFEKNPITHDPRTKKQIAAYREKERNRRRYIDDYKQWRKYKAAFGKDIPDFETFRAHKLKDDDKYKEWLHNFRSFRTKENRIPLQAEAEQLDLLKKYGNINEMMLYGSSEDMERWGALNKITGKGEKEILSKLSDNADNWELLLEMQTESTMKPFTNQLLKKATDSELGALRLWTGETYANINRYVRYGINVDDISKNAAREIENILGKLSTPTEIIVRRGTGTKHIFENIKGDWKNDPSVLMGQKFRDKGFTATSPFKEGGFSGVGESQAELFIKVPKGTHGAYIESVAHNEAEKEFLLQKNYSYRIIKAEYRENPIFKDEKDLKVWVEVIDE